MRGWMVFACLAASPSLALGADGERRAQALFSHLRCMVCAGESIAASDAGPSRDIRDQVRERIARGESDAAIERYLAQRYGDRILADPPMAARTIALWGIPAMLLALGGAVAWRRTRQ